MKEKIIALTGCSSEKDIAFLCLGAYRDLYSVAYTDTYGEYHIYLLTANKISDEIEVRYQNHIRMEKSHAITGEICQKVLEWSKGL